MNARILCLDVGDKRIGVAVSDPMGLTAQGLTTLIRKNFKQDCTHILKVLKEYEVQTILIGYPLDTSHSEGPQAKKVKFFVEGLKKILQENQFAVEIKLWDESFSSREAEEILLEADLSRKKRRKVIDRLAAALILQSYLDAYLETAKK
ncbi:MAG: Holliday junction DNA helicase RuvA [Deltaproteobacteria bacterium RIFCSPLOWO2_01_44_7]|nr:MAG: Holliday junction DNA helicase RuvA [Deltaproteobacteria bacterium RIFCSPHIGHO2_01_FULL_43_49]OGQ14527.1 MAG: Holliday junction DNA helicase RuvA [Deltaproteobacteria bacterium RIFCSPHIGHO2_02_FULL_44_53]OGQ27913.1 MAG: Holliday junction DNA helicase RuvA [Deltaproteobacteria bacterium RIFCSPHIGHO2_12_FULL_44_21]OGQ31125.1 MAG: Holliday junction DNA helicase RuvA [Deltaproteobacteria bacterium RIFCSPLOWO2_01_FULL_45_74]OGQ38219.1 MAG: Holliday junction DNA helicase RuvA [Deltaproteobact